MEMEWLPAGAKRIEYLESTGTQWIDTGIHPLKGYGFELYGGFTEFQNSEFFGGGTAWSNGLGICTHGGVYGVIVGTTEVCRITAENNVMHLFRVGSDGTVYVDGTYQGISTTEPPSGDYTMNIFRHSATQVPLKEKIFYVNIFYFDSLIFSGIPIRIGTSGYLFDKVSRQIFTNSGTGDFVLGRDI